MGSVSARSCLLRADQFGKTADHGRDIDRLFPNRDILELGAERHLVVAGGEQERHTARPELSCNGKYPVAANVHIKHRAVDDRAVPEQPQRIFDLADRARDLGTEGPQHAADVVGEKILVLDDEDSAAR